MNIFVTSADPEACAKFLDNKRVVKMILESYQLLSTAVVSHGAPGWYRPTHTKHPCTVWTQTARSNYLWLCEHAKALLSEYTERYKRVHLCDVFSRVSIERATSIPDGPLTEFANCTNFKHLPVHEAYVQQLLAKWNEDKRKPEWSKGVLA